VESIIASSPSVNNPNQYVFLVKWRHCMQEENTWETYENVAHHDMGLLKNYYERNLAMERDGRFGPNKRRKLIRRENMGQEDHR